MEKLIITVALTGNVPTREMTPHVPLTAEEMAADVKRCMDAGASLFHVHARNREGRPTLDIDRFSRTVRRIKDLAPEGILQLSTGGRASSQPEDRIAPVHLRPEMASFTTGSNNMPGMIYENSPRFIEDLAHAFRDTGVKPEIEVFEPGMVNNALFLQRKGHLASGPLHFDFVMDVPGAIPGTVKNLQFLSELIPTNATWTVAGIGRREIPLGTAAIVMGGHVRVGLEDNLMMPEGTPATNAALVEKIVRIARETGREIASPAEARHILSLNPAHKNRILENLPDEQESDEDQSIKNDNTPTLGNGTF